MKVCCKVKKPLLAIALCVVCIGVLFYIFSGLSGRVEPRHHKPFDVLTRSRNSFNVINETTKANKVGVNWIQKVKRLSKYRENVQSLPRFRKGTNVTKSLEYKMADIRLRLMDRVNCAAIFKGDRNAIQLAENLTYAFQRNMVRRSLYISMTSADCSSFIRSRGYDIFPVTAEEESFPLAFSIVMYKDVEQAERLLRSIYRPHNLYCVHVDNKSHPDVFTAMVNIANCFNNVFMSSERVSVTWGEMSVLKTELNCMQDLWKKSKGWKYFINLTGQEFPLKTNLELVRILKTYNGSNNVVTSDSVPTRWSHAGRPPHDAVPRKGSVHVVVSREFVSYVLNDRRAKDILNWTSHTRIPDETFFSTLNTNLHLGVPGASKVGIVLQPKLRFKLWVTTNIPCHGNYVRKICVLSLRDLPNLRKRTALFVNKFLLSFSPIAYECMEEMMYNMTVKEVSDQHYSGRVNLKDKWIPVKR